MNDQERMTDFLCSEKKMTSNYDTYASECVNIPLRDAFLGQPEAHRTAVRPERSPRRAPRAAARRGPFFRGGKKSWGKRPASIEKQGEIAYNQGDKTPSEERD